MSNENVPMSTTWHPSDEDLILHFYAEGDPSWSRRVDAHLVECAFCRRAWEDLATTMSLVDRAAVSEPADGFERVMWARVQQALPSRTRTPWGLRVLLPMAATVVISLLAGGYVWRSLQPTASPAVGADLVTGTEIAGTASTARSRQALSERVLLTALDDHFQQAQMLLVELNNAPEDASDLLFERAAADELISSSRLYRMTARQHGDGRMAEVLEDLESVFVEVARHSGDSGATGLRTVRARIASQDLLFKVRATARQIQDRQRHLLSASANE
jgi:hypothetical protein